MFKQGLLVLAASLFLQIAWAEEYDPVKHARASLIATIAELDVPTGSPNTEGTRRHAVWDDGNQKCTFALSRRRTDC